MSAHIVFFCPDCYAEIPETCVRCPHCGSDIQVWRARPYAERLRSALHHPLSEVRMAAIISLAYQRELESAMPLARCALAHPHDIVQALEIVQAIAHLPEGEEHTAALQLLKEHPIGAVTRRVGALLASSS